MDFVKDADSHGYIVHHKSYIDMNNIYNPDITINFDNLELLCIDCHNKEHFSNNMFNADGELIEQHKKAIDLCGIYRK